MGNWRSIKVIETFTYRADSHKPNEGTHDLADAVLIIDFNTRASFVRVEIRTDCNAGRFRQPGGPREMYGN